MSVQPMSPYRSLEQRLYNCERFAVENTKKLNAQIRETDAQIRETDELQARIHAQIGGWTNPTEKFHESIGGSLKDARASWQDQRQEANGLRNTTDKLLPSIDNPPSVSSHDQREKVTPHNDKTSADSSATVKKEPFLTRLFHAIYAWFKSIFCKLKI